VSYSPGPPGQGLGAGGRRREAVLRSCQALPPEVQMTFHRTTLTVCTIYSQITVWTDGRLCEGLPCWALRRKRGQAMRGLAMLGAAKEAREAKQGRRLAATQGGLLEGGERGNGARATPSHTRDSPYKGAREGMLPQEGGKGGNAPHATPPGRRKLMARRLACD
jgi:hypothetical protein